MLCYVMNNRHLIKCSILLILYIRFLLFLMNLVKKTVASRRISRTDNLSLKDYGSPYMNSSTTCVIKESFCIANLWVSFLFLLCREITCSLYFSCIYQGLPYHSTYMINILTWSSFLLEVIQIWRHSLDVILMYIVSSPFDNSIYVS